MSPLEQGFSAASQQVGERTDGATLRAIRVEGGDAFHRLTFELDSTVVPFTTALLEESVPAIIISMHGVRFDETGNRPLVNELGEPFGSPVVVDLPPIIEYGSRLVLDDSLLAYEVRLSSPALFRLGSEGTSRVVLDIFARE